MYVSFFVGKLPTPGIARIICFSLQIVLTVFCERTPIRTGIILNPQKAEYSVILPTAFRTNVIIMTVLQRSAATDRAFVHESLERQHENVIVRHWSVNDHGTEIALLFQQLGADVAKRILKEPFRIFPEQENAIAFLCIHVGQEVFHRTPSGGSICTGERLNEYVLPMKEAQNDDR